jgi:hypothetical protein
MDRKNALLGLLAGVALAAGATAATAGDRSGHDGWRVERCGCMVRVRHVVRHVRHVVHVRYVAPLPLPAPAIVERHEEVVDEGMALPASFFEDTGGVGPAFIEGGGGSGGFVIEEAAAQANASASASARASVSIDVQEHMMKMRMMKMQMMKMKMMPRSYGHKW